MSQATYTVEWDDGVIVTIDQRALPHETVLIRLTTVDELVEAIATLAIRGAPALGAAGALGVAQSARRHLAPGGGGEDEVRHEARRIAEARPTAVNLGWGVSRALARLTEGADAVLDEATALLELDARANRTASRRAADEMLRRCARRPIRALTHCNTGRLATASWGTALGALRDLFERGHLEIVYVDETRPLLQGARLTTWELAEAGIPYRLNVDSAAAVLMARDMVDCVVVGADRITSDGHVANKIGTYALAVAAARHGVPFFVVAPESTIDPTLEGGDSIVVEERGADEVRAIHGVPVAPVDAPVFNPAFDVTPPELITAIATEVRLLPGADLASGAVRADATSVHRHDGPPAPGDEVGDPGTKPLDRWDESEAARYPGAVGACVYASRLLGADSRLVLCGGGNSSAKTVITDRTGARVEVLHVKGSGWDMADIGEGGFAPLRLGRLRDLLNVERMSDSEMMNELRCALIDASAPDPSVETLLHAVLPHRYVLHTHADAVLALTNSRDGERRVREIYRRRAVIVPYVMPGFDLARECASRFPAESGPDTIGMVLLNHGVFSFGETAREAYERMIELVTLAANELDGGARALLPDGQDTDGEVRPEDLAALRADISRVAGRPMIATRSVAPDVRAFLAREDLAEIASQGPATPDHVIRTKRLPMLGRDVDGYATDYESYFTEHQKQQASTARRGRQDQREALRMLDPAPRIVLDQELGMVAAGRAAKDALAAAEIYRHTMAIITRAQELGGYRALPASDLFDMEYWELEQAKLRRGAPAREFTGEVALVTGAASGIGRACATALMERGCAVVGVDIDPRVEAVAARPDYLGVVADVTDRRAVTEAVRRAADRFGGLDIVVAAAGVFGETRPLATWDESAWRRTMAINADALPVLFSATHALLRLAPRKGRVVVVGSRNAAAPGPGVAAYSASKAAATQVARVAALEWAPDGIRVNVVHPDAVFDTALWTSERLAERAREYGVTVEEYRRRNLLRTEVTSAGVGELVADMCGATYATTTGAQVPIDGGNVRVV